MGVPIVLTVPPARATADGAVQSYQLVFDASAYKQLDLQLRVYELTGSSPEVTVTMQTSMQNLSDAAELWNDLTGFDSVNATNKTKFLSLSSGMLHYVRWKVVVNTGTLTAVTFDITGIGRLD